MRRWLYTTAVAVLAATLSPLISGCGVDFCKGQPASIFCPDNPGPGQTGAGGGPAAFGCDGLPGQNLWECNLDSALGAPIPGVPPPAPGMCGVVKCARDAANAKQEAAALAGVAADDPRLACISLGTNVISVTHGLTIAENTFNAPGAVCVHKEGPGCDPCSDGQGNTLQNVGEDCNGGTKLCCQGLTCVGAQASTPGTCQGTAQCQKKPPALMPLTTDKLRAIAMAQGIGAGTMGIQFNRAVGLAFENWVLTTMGQNNPRNTMPFMSPLRQQQTGGLPGSVIPEYVAPLALWWGGQPWPAFQGSLFFEMKAVTGALTQSTSKYQLLGLIDVASRSPAGAANQPTPPATACVSTTQPNHPPPALVFTTTGNTNLDLTMLQKATQLCVAIWQQIVMYDANTDPNNPDLYLDQALPANQAVYGAAVPLPMHPAWPHSPLTSPTSPPMPVPGDPDPPEVD